MRGRVQHVAGPRPCKERVRRRNADAVVFAAPPAWLPKVFSSSSTGGNRDRASKRAASRGKQVLLPRRNELKELATSRGLAWRRPGAKKVWGFERKATYASRLAAHEDCFPAVDALKARIRLGGAGRRHPRSRGRPSRKDSPPGSLRSHGGRPPSTLRVNCNTSGNY